MIGIIAGWVCVIVLVTGGVVLATMGRIDDATGLIVFAIFGGCLLAIVESNM